MRQTQLKTKSTEIRSFLGEFIRSPISTGSIIPSSRQLAKLMTHTIDENTQNIVEFGPGTGSFTRMIHQKKNKDTRFAVVEINQRFREHIKSLFPDVEVYDSLQPETSGFVGNVDAVVSGLPFSNMKWEDSEDIINSIHGMLAPGGEFKTFLYFHTFQLGKNRVLIDYLRSQFASVNLNFVARNIPPAVVVSAYKKS